MKNLVSFAVCFLILGLNILHGQIVRESKESIKLLVTPTEKKSTSMIDHSSQKQFL